MRCGRWSLLLAALSAFGPAAAGGQAAGAKRQIATLEDEWIQAVIRRDAMAFNRLLAPDFVYTEDDRVYTKAQLIKEITSGSDTVTSGRNEELTVRVHDCTGVATGWLILVGRGSTGPFERRYRYTDTWIRMGGRWRVLAAQDYFKP